MRLLRLDYVMTSYTNARPETALFAVAQRAVGGSRHPDVDEFPLPVCWQTG